MKKGLIFGLLVALSCPAFAQLTEGEPTAKKIRTGNRAEQGDFGIYVGATTSMFKAMFDSEGSDGQEIEIQPIPLINFKYMLTDQFEARVGLEFSKKKESVKGDYITGTDYDEQSENINYETENRKYKAIDADNRIIPGFAYHFSRSNLLDVYAGAELPFGWKRYKYSTEDSESSSSYTRGGFQIGLGAFIGLQMHIADLPLAVGLEYGISSMFDARGKVKAVAESGGTKTVTYQPNIESFPMLKEQLPDSSWESLKARKGEIGNQLRITLTYYFK